MEEDDQPEMDALKKLAFLETMLLRTIVSSLKHFKQK